MYTNIVFEIFAGVGVHNEKKKNNTVKSCSWFDDDRNIYWRVYTQG